MVCLDDALKLNYGIDLFQLNFDLTICLTQYNATVHIYTKIRLFLANVDSSGAIVFTR